MAPIFINQTIKYISDNFLSVFHFPKNDHLLWGMLFDISPLICPEQVLTDCLL